MHHAAAAILRACERACFRNSCHSLMSETAFKLACMRTKIKSLRVNCPYENLVSIVDGEKRVVLECRRH